MVNYLDYILLSNMIEMVKNMHTKYGISYSDICADLKKKLIENYGTNHFPGIVSNLKEQCFDDQEDEYIRTLLIKALEEK